MRGRQSEKLPFAPRLTPYPSNSSKQSNVNLLLDPHPHRDYDHNQLSSTPPIIPVQQTAEIVNINISNSLQSREEPFFPHPSQIPVHNPSQPPHPPLHHSWLPSRELLESAISSRQPKAYAGASMLASTLQAVLRTSCCEV